MFPLCNAELPFAHPRAYSTAWECVRVSGMIRLAKSLGTSWTVRIAKLMYREKKGGGKCSNERSIVSQISALQAAHLPRCAIVTNTRELWAALPHECHASFHRIWVMTATHVPLGFQIQVLRKGGTISII